MKIKSEQRNSLCQKIQSDTPIIIINLTQTIYSFYNLSKDEITNTCYEIFFAEELSLIKCKINAYVVINTLNI